MRTQSRMPLGKVGRRVVEGAFDGGDIASGGVTLVRLVDELLGLTRAAARALEDGRRAASVLHSMRSLLAQRVYGLCCGWEDVSDHNTLRRDLVWQTAVGRDAELAGAAALSRLDNAATARTAWALHGVLLAQFVASHKTAPTERVLDVDATDIPLHGQQEHAHFNAHYDNYCYLPLYVFCGQDLLACVLRPSWRDPASIVSAVLKRLAEQLRQAWPGVRLLLAALAYTLMVNLRRLALKGTALERACTATIRTRLLKIGGAVLRNTRRVRLLLASSHPLREVFASAVARLAASP